MMRRYARPLFATLALIGAFYITAYREGSRGLWLDVNRPIAAQTRMRAPYDLSSLNVLNKVVVLVKENYVEPRRIDPRKMLQSALDYVQRNVAEVMVDQDKGGGQLTVKVADTEKQFPIDDVTSPWA
jgi:carboxyl-terminal processing protease